MAEVGLVTLPWIAGASLVVLGALLALDDTALVQTWFSQPLPAGLLAGAVCGDVVTGAAIGLPLQLLVLANLPVGQTFLCEPTEVVVAAVGAARFRGLGFDLADALGIGIMAPQLGWLLVGCAGVSLLGHAVLQAERRAHFLWMLAGHRTLRDGSLARIDRLQVRCLVTTLVRGAGLTVASFGVFAWLWLPRVGDLPDSLLRGFGWLPVAAAGIAVGVLIERYQFRHAWTWLLAGTAGGWALTSWIG